MKLPARRRFLQGGLAAASLLLPARLAWAQSEGAAKLLRLPKVALVIGNSAYKHVGVLKNPGNDAQGMAEALRAAGFEVTLLRDATQKQMRDAFDAHARALAARKGVGLVYFAGHGFQLAWRNYLLPVEAELARIEDVPSRCIDIGGMFDVIGKSGNAMNVVILDACRNNPFSTDFRLAPGLSQMDAPPATLLAYATAPGNEARDGENPDSKHGLYTSHLLREMQVRDAKIEDVFKRVRLGVRRASRGEQIPWESTSLEEDFYFLPPETLKKFSEEEEAKQLAVEKAFYDRVLAAPTPQLAEEYLRTYPSGRFAELAQLRLDNLLAAQGEKRVEAVSPRENPNTVGSARADTGFKVGDRYVYRRVGPSRGGADTEVVQVVKAIVGDEVIFSNGFICDLLGNTRQLPDGRRITARQELPLEYQVGKRWTSRYEISGPRGEGTVDMDYRIVSREKITVPAGTFDCFRIEGRGVNRNPARAPVDVRLTHWRAPDLVRRPIAGEERRRGAPGGHVTSYQERRELVSFQQA